MTLNNYPDLINAAGNNKIFIDPSISADANLNEDHLFYSCKSSLANLCQLIELNALSLVEPTFYSLNREDQCLIYKMICQSVGAPETTDLWSGKPHVFDDINIFISAVPKAIELKYQGLSNSQKETTHENVYRLAEEPFTSYPGTEWGRLCAMNNLPRLADAMAENKRTTIERIPSLRITKLSLKLEEAFNKFKNHPDYQQLLQKKVFLSETEMKVFFKQAILEGTCDSQTIELIKLADTHPVWNRTALLTAVKIEDVFYNQIIMFSKSKIGSELNNPSLNPKEKKQLLSIIECLQTSQPIHQRIQSDSFKADENQNKYLQMYDKFLFENKSTKDDKSFHGRVLIENICQVDGDGNVRYVNHAIFFQHLRKEQIFRFYDINSGFYEYFDIEQFIFNLRSIIGNNYNKSEASSTVRFVVEANETKFPCRSDLGQLYQSVIKNQDQKEIETAFSHLRYEDQCAIFGKIYQYAGEPATNDQQWGEHHVFDSPEILKTAITNEIIQRYLQSDEVIQNQIHLKVARLDEDTPLHYSGKPAEWGRLRALNNLPRLADAML